VTAAAWERVGVVLAVVAVLAVLYQVAAVMGLLP
jgi:hypothetical protein